MVRAVARALAIGLLLMVGPLLAPPAYAGGTPTPTPPPPPPAITVGTPGTVVAGEVFTVTGDVPSDFPDDPSTMTFTLDGAVEPVVKVPYIGSGTTWTARFTVLKPGTYSVSAGMPGWTAGESKVTVTAPAPVVTLKQGTTTSVIGTAVTLTATVTGGTGEGEWFISVQPPGSTDPRVIKRVVGRSTTVDYTGTVAGDHTFVARWQQDPYQSPATAPSGTVVHTWTRPLPGLTLTQSSARSTVGTTLTLTATLSDAADREGALRMSVDGVGAPVRIAVTGEAPTFTASYVGAAAAAGHTHTITATWTEDGRVVATTTTEHAWDAAEIAASVAPSPADIGQTATVSIRVPDLLGGTLQVRILTGPHAGPLTVTGTAPNFTASYVGRFPGRDEIQASVVDSRAGTFSSGVVTTDWNTPKVVLTPPSGTSSLVGTVQAVTAKVTGVTSGVVTFGVTGANAGVTVTRGGGHPVTTGSWVGANAGTDTVTASITVNDKTYTSDPLTFTWVKPTIVVGQSTMTSGVDQPVQLTATVSPAGVTGAVTFTVRSPSSAPLTFRDDGTDGSWTASYTRRSAGTDTITATLSGPTGGAFAAPAITHVWTVAAPTTVVLSPAGATTCTGSPFTPTVTVTREGRPVPAATVTVTVTGPGVPDRVRTLTTDADGRAAFTYSRTTEGADSATATAQLGEATLASAPIAHLWQDCGLTVTIAPPGTTTTAGSRFTPTVTVLDARGVPVGGAAVALRAVFPGQPDATPALTTNDDGTATAGWTRPLAGAERIEAVVTAGERTGRATVDHFWAPAGLEVALTPAGTASPAGSAFTATALVTAAGRPVPGVALTFRALLPGQPDITGAVVTDGSGLGSVTFTRPVAGTDTITVDAVVGGRTGRATGIHLWTAVAGIAMTLGPAGTVSPVGTPFSVTATLLSGGLPVVGVDVAFRASTDGQLDRTGTARTDAAGHATFTWVRDAAGPDTVVATVALSDGRRAQASVQHLWRAADPTAPVVPARTMPTLEVRGGAVPGGAVTLVGTGCPARSTVTLLVDGRPVASTAVRADGGYQTTVAVPPLAVGRHALAAVCAAERANGHLDVVVPTSTNGTAAAAATTAMATFGFFVLLGGQVVRFSGGYTSGS